MASAELTQSGFNQFLQTCFPTSATSTAQFQYFAIGTDSTAASTADTGLAGTVTSWTVGGTSFKAYLSVTHDPTNEKVYLRGFVSAAEATSKVLYEYTDLTNNTTKIPAARFVWTDPITKTTANQLTIVTVYKRV